MTEKELSRLPDKPKSNYSNLVDAIGSLIQSARSRVVQTINTEMVHLYWEIGRHIVEYEQRGSDRARYGARLLERLSLDLTNRVGKGFSTTNLKYMRMVYESFPIRQSLTDESKTGEKLEINLKVKSFTQLTNGENVTLTFYTGDAVPYSSVKNEQKMQEYSVT